MNDTTTPTETSPNASSATSDTVLDQASGLLDQAKGAIGEAFDATVGAAKEHPIAAAAIATGAAAAIAGAVYGGSKLLTPETPAKGGKKS